MTVAAPDRLPEQVGLPGGAAEEGDAGPVGTALREAEEEVGLDHADVRIIAVLPAFALPDSGFMLTPVLAWTAGFQFPTQTNPG